MTEKVDTTTLAFTWAALGAAETLLHSLSRNGTKARSHAELLVDFVTDGKLGLAPTYYVDKMAEQYPDLVTYQYAANRLLTQISTERAALAAE